jgi:hypothetical protein
MGNAAAAAALAELMDGHTASARDWFAKAVERYHESYKHAPPGSWGRPIGILKARILAADWEGAERDASWTLDQRPSETDSPIGLYAGCLALLVLGRDTEARVLADGLRTQPDFPADVGDALAFIAAHETVGYIEDLPVADTVLVLQALAASRDMAADLSSDLLPRNP